jgi:hypothetical protein
MNKIIAVTTLAALAFTAVAYAQQPNWRAQPTYTTVNLSAGFTPDPWTQPLQAGGGDAISNTVRGCSGYINAAAPDVDLNYRAGSLPLHIRVASGSDTTLAVLDPQGNWHCNDDSVGLDPLVTLQNPPSGNYNIWVGTFSSGRLAPATLVISELNSVARSDSGTLLGGGSGSRGGSAGQPNWRAQPIFGTANLRAGFTPDPWRQDLQAGGGDNASDSVGGQCRGYINNAAPDVDLNYTAGSLPLYFRVASNADTTLLVLDPNGNWHCNDDSIGLDPVVHIQRPASGNYNIWVGTFSSGALQQAQLRISELDPNR